MRYSKLAILILFPALLFCQGKSITLFDNLGVDPNSMTTGFPNDHCYVLKSNPCYGFIFKENGEVWYRDYCPIDYLDVAEFGSYSIFEDTVLISSTNLSTADRIHRLAIKTLELKPILEDTFFINSYNEHGEEDGLVFSIYYQECTWWPWKKDKYIDLRRSHDWTSFPKEIYVKSIWVSGLENQPPNNGICFAINEKWNLPKHKIDISFFGNALKVVKADAEIHLLRWDRKAEAYVFFDKMLYR